MKVIWLIAQNTITELLRNRVLYILLLFVLFLMGLMLALGQLSHTERERLTLGLGLPSIHFCLVLLTIFIGGSLVYKEIERLTIVTLLARPIRRYQFLLGKYLGFMTVLKFIAFSLFLLFYGNMLLMGYDISFGILFLVFVGFLLEMSLLLAVTLFFSSFSGTFLTVSFAFCFFLVGHWVDRLKGLKHITDEGLSLYSSSIVSYLVPNLEYYNWRGFFYTDNWSLYDVGMAYIHCMAWGSAFLLLTIISFNDRDFA